MESSAIKYEIVLFFSKSKNKSFDLKTVIGIRSGFKR